MLKNYFIIAVRSLLKNKLYSLINITGLSVGITVSILILIFVAHEFSFDKFHSNGDRIFRSEKIFSRDGRHSLYANPQFGPELKAIDPHIENYVRLPDCSCLEGLLHHSDFKLFTGFIRAAFMA
jgi:putative ABC transport system permease protein